jgi:hypothetical protein
MSGGVVPFFEQLRLDGQEKKAGAQLRLLDTVLPDAKSRLVAVVAADEMAGEILSDLKAALRRVDEETEAAEKEKALTEQENVCAVADVSRQPSPRPPTPLHRVASEPANTALQEKTTRQDLHPPSGEAMGGAPAPAPTVDSPPPSVEPELQLPIPRRRRYIQSVKKRREKE